MRKPTNTRRKWAIWTSGAGRAPNRGWTRQFPSGHPPVLTNGSCCDRASRAKWDRVCSTNVSTRSVRDAACRQPTISALSTPPFTASVSAAFHRNAACSLGVLNTVDRPKRESHLLLNSSVRGDWVPWRKATASRPVWKNYVSAEPIPSSEIENTFRSNDVSGLKLAKTEASTWSAGELSNRETLAEARIALPFVECFWRYCELKCSNDTSSGSSFVSASLTTGPMGSGGSCGAEDTTMPFRRGSHYRSMTDSRVCLKCARRMCNSGSSASRACALWRALTACRYFSSGTVNAVSHFLSDAYALRRTATS